jgi:hypothetical protein
MYVSASESRVLARIFGLLSEDLSEHDVREAVGHHLLELLEADHYASFVWQDATGRFEKAVYLNMDPANIAAYDRYYQQHDPITSKLQARREATLVTQVMPQRDLMRTEFFNDFLARDGLHWGVNAYSYVGGRNIGDVRIWRGRRRENFDGHTLELLRLIRAGLHRGAGPRGRRCGGHRDGWLTDPETLGARIRDRANDIGRSQRQGDCAPAAGRGLNRPYPYRADFRQARRPPP